jgi:uncharacterized protein (DUF58 family)
VAGIPDRLLRRLEWKVVRRLDGRLLGPYRTIFRGTGIDFADLREYTPEDDVRHIDWNVTARMDEPYVREYTEDRDLTAWLVIDQSASMRFGGGTGKDATGTELAVCLARLFTQGGSQVGALLYDNLWHRTIPPRSGRTHVLRLAHELTRPAPPGADGRPTNLVAMLELAARTARRPSLVFVISDFIGTGDWGAGLRRLTARHEVVAVRVVDPVEFELPDVGVILIEDAETGEQVFADSSDPFFRKRLRERVASRERAVTGAINRSGASGHRVGTDEDLTAALMGMVRRSRARRR